jgi:hypothetical protein
VNYWEARINGVNYPIAQENGRVLWETERVAEDRPEEWTDWSRGLGEHYIKCEGFDATTPNVLRLSPFYHADNNPTDLTTARGYFMEEVGAAATVTHVDTVEGKAENNTTLTVSKTIAAGSYRLLLVALHLSAGTTGANISVTYGGVALTPIVSSSSAADPFVIFYYMVTPPVGTDDVVATVSATNDIILGVSNYTGVNQANPFRNAVGASGTGASMSLAISSATNDVCVDAASIDNDLSIAPASGETERWNTDNTLLITDALTGAGSEEAGASSVTMSHTWSGTGVATATWRVVIVSIQPQTAIYTYVADGTKIAEYTYDSDTGLTDVATQTHAGTAGRPAKFKGKWYVPFGTGDNVQRLDTPGGGAAAWADSGFKAAHLAVFQKGVSATLARAEATDTNEVGLATAAPTADNSFDAGIEVGDTSTDITDLTEAGGQLYVAKEDGLYEFGAEGASRQVLPQAFDRGRPDTENGQGMVAFGDIIYYPSNQGLWRYRIGYGALPVGLATLRGLRTLSNITTPKHYRHADIAVAGEWLYELANYGEESILLAMRQQRRGDPGNHEMIIHSVLNIPLSKGIYKDSQNYLWIKGASSAESDRDIRVIVLDEHGGLDTTSRRGLADGDHDITLMESDWGRKREIKQLRGMTVNVINSASNITALAKAYLDASAIATINASTISFGSVVPVTRNYTVGTSDTAYRAHGHLTATTASYTPKTENPEIGGITLWARFPEILRVVVDSRNLEGYGMDAVTAEKNLRRLQQQGPVTIRRPGEEVTFSGICSRRQEVAQRGLRPSVLVPPPVAVSSLWSHPCQFSKV